MSNFFEIFNAKLNKDHTIEVHINKSYTKSLTNHFYLYCDGVRICELTVKDSRESGHHFHYVLDNVPALTIGSEYRIYDDHYLPCNLNMDVLLKNEKICSLYYCNEVMGAHYHKFFTTFRLFSPLAYKAYVVISKDNNDEIHLMEKNTDNGVFTIRVNGDLARYNYHFVVRINGELISANDPYCRSLTNQSVHGVIVNPSEVYVDLKNECLPEFTNPTDAIIYELSVRDMTSMKDTSIRHKGKFLGLTETSCKSRNSNPIGIDYLKYLGVTHVQIMPMYDFCTVCDSHPQEAYNWGYDPLYYNAPEGSYSSDPDNPYSRIIDLKKMIASFHKAGIRVVMDVVFNHVFNLESSCFEKLCPSYYFRYDNDGNPSNGSFCGNEFNSMHPMAKKFIIDTCLMWVNEYGVDGFRFDLMGLIDIDTIKEIKRQCELIKPGFLVYGEGWEMPTVLSADKMAKMANAYRMPQVAFFNDRFRDVVKGKSSDFELAVKGYLSGDVNYIDGFKHCLLGSIAPIAFPPLFVVPSQSINYVECHDNATVYDKLKVSNSYEDEETILKRIKLINALTVFSYGIPFIHAGQEIGMSKRNIYNSYNSGDDINHFDYNLMDRRFDMVNYMHDVIKFKKVHKFLKLDSKTAIENTVKFTNLDFGALLVTYTGREILPFSEVKMIINPTNTKFKYNLNDNYHLLFDEKGMTDESQELSEVEVLPISLMILSK